jgi:LysM repeat protein
LSSAAIFPNQTLLINKLKSINSVMTPVKSGENNSSVLIPNKPLHFYAVAAGDTLSFIANKYQVDVDDLQDWNGLTTSLIRVGQQLRLNDPSKMDMDLPKATQSPVVKSEPVKPSSDGNYTVKQGDTLSKIALSARTSVSSLKALNHLSSDIILIGQSIKVGASSVPSSTGYTPIPPTNTSNILKYTVKTGDTLGQIALKFGVSVESLMSFNKLSSSIIFAGQTLFLSGDATTVVDVPKKSAPPIANTSTDPNNNFPSTSVIQEAMKWIGTPYVWGGISKNGFDCSGFIYYVTNQTGKSIGRYSSEGYYDRSYYVDTPQPGDLVFFENTYRPGISHIGFYIGQQQFIHAANENVEISSLASPYWKSKFESFKRFY